MAYTPALNALAGKKPGADELEDSDSGTVRDIVIEPRTNDLVLATHGRGILIVDDISPLRKINDVLLNSDVAVIPSRPAPVTVGHYGGLARCRWLCGPNSSEQAQILYYLKDRVSSGP